MKPFRWISYLGICLALLFAVGCATGESTISPAFYEVEMERIALVDISGDIRGNAPKNQVEDFFTAEMMTKGYRVIERSRVQSVLEEQDFQLSDRTSDRETAKIGEILNVAGTAMLDVSVSGQKVSVTGRLVDAQTGEVLWIGTGRGGSGTGFATLGGAIGGAVLGSQVGSGSGRMAGTIAGGVLGGAAGDALSPQVARVVQNSIKQMVDEFPARE